MRTKLAIIAFLAALPAIPLLAGNAEPAVPSYPFIPYKQLSGEKQVAHDKPASYSVEATLTPLKGKTTYVLGVRISELEEQQGMLTEKLISQPKLVSELGVPATIYLGPESGGADYMKAENITVQVSWSKSDESSVAICAVTIRRGDKPVWKSQMQTAIAAENHVANASPTVSSPDIDFVEAKPPLKLGGAIPKHKQRPSSASSAVGNPAILTLEERLLHADLSRALKHYERVMLMAYETELQLALTSGGTEASDKERSALDKRLIVLRQKVDELRANASECDKQLQKLRGGGLPTGQVLPAEQVYK